MLRFSRFGFIYGPRYIAFDTLVLFNDWSMRTGTLCTLVLVMVSIVNISELHYMILNKVEIK
jgi:hypothetical protein